MSRKQLINRAAYEIAQMIDWEHEDGARPTLAMLEQRAAAESASVETDDAIRALYPLTNDERAEIIRRAEDYSRRDLAR